MTDTPSRLHNLSLPELLSELNDIAARDAANKEAKALVNAELDRRHGAQLAAALAQTGNTTGTVSIEVDGFTLKRTTKKKVDHDGAALQKIAASMPWGVASALFKISVDLPEKNYPGLAANPDLKAQIDAARTVTPVPEAIKITAPA